MRPLTIALCLHGYFPDQFFGTAVYARQLAEALQRRGNRVVIVVPRFDASLDHPRLSEPEWLGGIEIRRILRPRMRGMRDTFDDPRLMPLLRETFSAIGADIVHLAHFLGLGTALFAAAKSLNLPIFATLTDFHGFCHRGTLLNSWGLTCKGPNRWRTNCVSCGLRDYADERPQSWTLAYLASWFARPTSAIALPLLTEMLPQQSGDDIRAIRQRPDRLFNEFTAIRAAIAPTRHLHDAYRRNGFAMSMDVQSFGIDADRSAKPPRQSDRLRLGFIGQIGKHKGSHILLAAARHLPVGRVAIRIWGDMERNTPYAASLRSAAWGLDVAFPGPLALEEVDAALRETDVLVLPSLWAENAPLILLQALATHTPCLVSDQPGMTEFVRNGVNGYAFPTGNARALAARIRHLADDGAHLARLTAQTAYERSSDDMAADAMDLYSRHGIA